MLIVKNTTVADIEILEVGDTLPASGQLTIDPTKYPYYAKAETLTEIDSDLSSGNIVINDGIRDLTYSQAKDYLEFRTAFGVPFLSNPDRNNGFSSKTTQEAIEEARSGFEGKGFQTTFAGNGTFRNAWFSQEDTNVESNESPDIFKYQARLVGVDFTNQNQNVDAIIIFAIKEYPFSNVNNPDRFYKWTINNARSAVETNQIGGFTVNAGDVMAVYLADNGSNANDVILTMDFIILSAPTTSLSFSYSQNFSSMDFPATNTIPEIFT